MSDRYFVDTNILIYAHDEMAGEKHLRARTLVARLWDDSTGVLSTQILQELCINLRRKIAVPLPLKEVQAILRNYSRWQVVVNTAESVLEALEIESRHKTSFWDALILQAADRAGATIVYSEDLSHGQMYGGVQVVNPFLD